MFFLYSIPDKVKTVAIKSYPIEKREEFIRENTILADLKHTPGCVHRIDSTQQTASSKSFLIVMDYIQNGDLGKFISHSAIDFIKKVLV